MFTVQTLKRTGHIQMGMLTKNLEKSYDLMTIIKRKNGTCVFVQNLLDTSIIW